MKEVSNWIGVDRNATGHVAVVSDPESGKGLQTGKAVPAYPREISRHDERASGGRQIQEGQGHKEQGIQNREGYQPQGLKGDYRYRRTDGLWNQLERLGGIRRNRRHGRSLQRDAPFVVVLPAPAFSKTKPD